MPPDRSRLSPAEPDFYIQSLLYDIDFSKRNPIRHTVQNLRHLQKEYGAHAPHEKLKEIDPVSYETIHEK